MVGDILYNSFLTSEHNRLDDLHLKQNRPISVNRTKTKAGELKILRSFWANFRKRETCCLNYVIFQSLSSTFIIYHCQLRFKFLSLELVNHRAAECRERDHL